MIDFCPRAEFPLGSGCVLPARVSCPFWVRTLTNQHLRELVVLSLQGQFTFTAGQGSASPSQWL